MNKIEQIIADNLMGNPLDSSQKEYLQQWLDENPKNKETYDRIRRGESTSIIINQDEYNLGERLSSQVLCAIKRSKSRRIAFKIATSSCAAILILSFYFLFSYQDEPEEIVANIEFINNSVPQEKIINNIVLTTSQGKEVLLDRPMRIDSVINHIYRNTNRKIEDIALNTISVPAKMEYELILPDGTKVWLNSNSELIFPSQFSDSLRTVELVGEAFFDVAKDNARPFIVKTKMLSTKVIGTKFMVTSYANLNEEVALVEGSVNVTSAISKQNTILKPGKGVTYNLKNKKYSVIDINEDNIINRKSGLFLFDNITLVDMTEIMKNWYGVDFKFLDESVKNEIFYLKSIKYDNIENLLLLLKDTRKITYTINNNIVTIKSIMPME